MEVGKTSTALKTDIEECHHLWDHHFCDWVAVSGVFSRYPGICFERDWRDDHALVTSPTLQLDLISP